MCVAEGRGLQRFILSYLPEIEVVAPAEPATRKSTANSPREPVPRGRESAEESARN